MEPIRIFAKKGTKEKVAMLVPQYAVRSVMQALTKEYGGDWIPVQQLKPGQMLKFDDDYTYRGYSEKFENYSSTVKDIPN